MKKTRLEKTKRIKKRERKTNERRDNQGVRIRAAGEGEKERKQRPIKMYKTRNN